MSEFSIELTKEQRAKIAESMGIVCDELILSSLTSSEQETKISDLGENMILAMGKTHEIS